MNDCVCEKLRRLTPYEPGIDDCRVHLDANESFVELTEAMKQKIADKMLGLHFNRYPDPLAGEVCGLFGRRYGLSPRFVTAGNGSDELIALLLNTFAQRGDKVLLTEPDFSMYRIYCVTAEVEPVVVGKDGDLGFDPDEIVERANAEKVRLILFSNPCNPTGQGISREDVFKIAEKANCLVVVDEAYMDFWDQSVLDRAPASKNLMVLKTLSKMGFAAGRLGFAVANEELTGYLRAAKSPYNVNALTQAAASVFLGEKGYLDGAVENIKRSRDSLFNELAKYAGTRDDMRVYPPHTNFVLVRFDDSAAVASALKASGISVRLISGCLRITAGTNEENRELLKALKDLSTVQNEKRIEKRAK